METRRRTLRRNYYIRTFLCDRCGKEIKPEAETDIIVGHHKMHIDKPIFAIKFIRATPVRASKSDYPCIGPKIFLCPECIKGLNRYLEGGDINE